MHIHVLRYDKSRPRRRRSVQSRFHPHPTGRLWRELLTEPGLLTELPTLNAGAAQKLAVLLLGHTLAALLNDRTHEESFIDSEQFLAYARGRHEWHHSTGHDVLKPKVKRRAHLPRSVRHRHIRWWG